MDGCERWSDHLTENQVIETDNGEVIRHTDTKVAKTSHNTGSHDVSGGNNAGEIKNCCKLFCKLPAGMALIHTFCAVCRRFTAY